MESRQSKGGKACAVIQKAKAAARLAAYIENPNYCKECNSPILPNNWRTISICKEMKFCGNACAAISNNRSRAHYKHSTEIRQKLSRVQKEKHPNPEFSLCKQCEKQFPYDGKSICSDECRKDFWRAHRRKQIYGEEEVANKLREEGWEILYTSNCCDRIGIKDGKVFFLEFKPFGNESLRTGQQRLSEVAKEQFLVVVHDAAGIKLRCA